MSKHNFEERFQKDLKISRTGKRRCAENTVMNNAYGHDMVHYKGRKFYRPLTCWTESKSNSREPYTFCKKEKINLSKQNKSREYSTNLMYEKLYPTCPDPILESNLLGMN